MELTIKMTPFVLILAYYIILNVIMVYFMRYDKNASMKKKWRVPEKRFFTIALLGGGFLGLCSMKWFRHKTKHISFTVIYTLSSLIHIGILYFLMTKFVFVFS